jgi:cytochrome c553
MISNFSNWRRLLFVVCWGACLATGFSIAGCSSGTSALPESVSAPTEGPATDPQVNQALANSCFDCHSNQGAGPWNAKIAPSYLFGADKARGVLNFSDWATLDVKQRRATAAAIASAVDSGSMPPGDYDFLHPSAKLSAEQKQLVLQWTSQQIALPAH